MFWDHLCKYNTDISALIALRERAELHSRSAIIIDIAEADVYMATVDDRCGFRALGYIAEADCTW